MNDDLKQKIENHYFNEYYQKIHDEDNSFLSKFGKFAERNDETLWGVAGAGFLGVAGACFFFPAVMLTPVVLVPVAISTMGVIAGVPALNTNVKDKHARQARRQIAADIESGTLLERYKKEVLVNDPQHKAELKKLEEAAAAEAFKKAAENEKKAAEEAHANTQQQIEQLRKNRPQKPILKK